MWQLSHSTKSDSPTTLDLCRKSFQTMMSQKDIGFYQIPERTELWTTSEARAAELRKKAKGMVVLGMGGSSLGGRALIQSLEKSNPTHQVEFIDNVDADRFWKFLRNRPDLQDLHWVIVSKSGNTIETLTMAECIDLHLRSGGFKKLSAVSTVISETGDNPLMRWARKENVPSLEIPKDVGGRYSVLTPVGLLPGAFYGLDMNGIRQGAAWALQQEELVTRLAAQALMSFERKEMITLFWAYAAGLKDFGAWTQQLWAESLGKSKNRKGLPAPHASTPLPCIGSSDQHSILQQVIEGQKDKFIWFTRVDQSEKDSNPIEKTLFDCQAIMHGKTMGQLFAAEAEATASALEKQGVQSLTLRTERLDEKSIGALFMTLELVVGTIGEALDINAFDQPGVELGKVLAREILQPKP